MVNIEYFAACTRGLEPALESELVALGADALDRRPGGVAFRGDRALGYRACMWLRSAIRVQELLTDAEVHDTDDLYDAVRRLPWAEWIAPEQTMAVFATTRNTESLNHSGFVALRIKDAVVDAIRDVKGARPNIDTRTPDAPLKAVLIRDRLQLYRDLAGRSLHKRGYRLQQVKSPLNEATAAGLLLLSEWDPSTTLVDPMCGSATFLIEAAWIAMDRAPGLTRSFAYERWIDAEPAVVKTVRDDAEARVRPSPSVCLEGADIHGGALRIARDSMNAAGVGEFIRLDHSDARSFAPSNSPRVVVTNPPYGKRLGEGEDVVDAWRSLGNFLHGACAGATAWVLSGDKSLTRHLGLRTSRRIPVMNGPIECRWLRYEIGKRHGARRESANRPPA